MPPSRAAPRGQHPRSEHCIGTPLDEGGDDVVDHLGGVLPIAVQQHDDVEAVGDRPAVPALLVAPIAKVAVVSDDRQRQIAACLVVKPNLVRVVRAGIVADQDLVHSASKMLRQPIEHRPQRRLGVVRNHQDTDTRCRTC